MDNWTKNILQYFKILERAVYSKVITMAFKESGFICGVVHSQYWLSPVADNDNEVK